MEWWLKRYWNHNLRCVVVFSFPGYENNAISSVIDHHFRILLLVCFIQTHFDNPGNFVEFAFPRSHILVTWPEIWSHLICSSLGFLDIHSVAIKNDGIKVDDARTRDSSVPLVVSLLLLALTARTSVALDDYPYRRRIPDLQSIKDDLVVFSSTLVNKFAAKLS